MPLPAGTKLGAYEIVAPVGAGGMGEVYRARDTRLDRTVALKLVNGSFPSLNGEALLEAEGRAVASLNHPHICALHDLGREAGARFLVMEYVAGETLANRLARGPLPVRDVVRFSIQIAEAIDHAHRNGVVHRDLKPSNIMLTATGVKVLDFGLATLRDAASIPAAASYDDSAATVKLRLTSEHALLGTVHYLAPERLDGAPADAASDLFAFGAVMYEMATGRRAFEGKSPAAVIEAILHDDPPSVTAVRPDLPRSLDWFIQKALSKTPSTRWHEAGDMVEVLRWIARGVDHSAPRTRSRLVMPVVLAALAGAAAVWLLVRPSHPIAAAAAPLSFSLYPPDGGGFTPTPSSVPTPQFALSPDGRKLAFVAAMGQDTSQLWLRPLDELQARPVAGTSGAEYPFWSPDGQSIGFFASGSLKRIDLAGGPARVLAAAPNGRGGAWSRSGVIVFAPTTQSGLFRVPAAGGDVAPLTQVDSSRHEASHRWPQFLPDDRHFIYFVQSTSPETHGIYAADMQAPSRTQRLITSELSAAFATPNRLVFVADEALMAAPFDWASLHLTGDPVPVISHVAGSSNFHAALSVSDTGMLAYASSVASSELVWEDREGRRVGTVGAPAEYVDFRLSPNDDQLAVAEVDPETHRPDVRVLDLQRGANVRLTYDSSTDASPVWSPDGQRIVFRSNRTGLHDLFQSAANGTGHESILLQSRNAKYPTDWVANCGIVYHTYQRGTGSDIWLVTPDGSTTTPLVQTPFDEMQGQLSPDGRWLAYTSLESGHAEVYVRSVANSTSRWQVSAGGGTDPRWRGDGRELFFVSEDSWITAVAFNGSTPAAPHRLFHAHLSPPGNPYLSNYDVTTDGRRFLLKLPVKDVTSSPIHVITDWAHLPIAR